MQLENTNVQIQEADLLTLAEVGKKLRCSRTFIFDLRKAGKLQAIKAGKKVLFSATSIQDYLNANMEGCSL